MRVVVDTNQFISALFWGGKPKRVIDLCLQGKAVLLLSEDILSELRRKIEQPKFKEDLDDLGRSVEEIIAVYRRESEIVIPSSVPEDAVRDPKDAFILACAVGGKADVIVSGDKDLTTLGEFRAIAILTPAQFLTLIELSDTP